MAEEQEFFTVASSARCKVQVGACRFFGSVSEIHSEEDAERFLGLVRAEHPDIKNHAWAFRLGSGSKGLARVFDGGEPSQSAGPPILRAIDHLQLTNTMIIVTRYFGEKQGVGGLIRAFHRTAATVLEEAGRRQELIYITVQALCSYEQLNLLLHELDKAGARNLLQNYQQAVEITAEIRPHVFDDLLRRISDGTKGSILLKRIEE